MTGKFVAYYRVSTIKQGINGLGMDAQRNATFTCIPFGSPAQFRSGIIAGPSHHSDS